MVLQFNNLLRMFKQPVSLSQIALSSFKLLLLDPKHPPFSSSSSPNPQLCTPLAELCSGL